MTKGMAVLGCLALSTVLTTGCRDSSTLTRSVAPRSSSAHDAEEGSTNYLTDVGPAHLWIGLKNSDDVGLRVDLRVEILVNGAVVASGDTTNIATGSSGFNNALLRTVAMSSTVNSAPIEDQATLELRTSVRRTCFGSGHNSGTVRLWYNGQAVDAGTGRDAGSRVDFAIGGQNETDYLRSGFALSDTAGSSRQASDVVVNSAAVCPDRPYSTIATWSRLVSVPSKFPLAGLVSYYRLDEAGGSTVVDAMGLHNGTNDGGTVGALGKIGTSYDYDGDGFSSRAYSDLNFGAGSYSSLSIQAWVKTTDTDGGVVTSRNGFDGNLVGLQVGSANGTPTFYLARLESITGTVPINDGNWHHLVGVFDGTTGMKYLYVDGVAQSGTAALATVTPLADFYLAWDAHLSNESIRYLAGTIDEVGIWNRALSPSEVLALYNGGAGLGILPAP